MRQKRERTPVQRLVIILSAISALLLSYYLGNQYGRMRLEQEISASLLVPPRELPSFTLSYGDDLPFTRDDLEGHWTLLYVGCLDCAVSQVEILPIFTRIYNRLADRPTLQEQLRLIFVSNRPDLDTPQELKEKLFYYHPELLGVTGREEELQGLLDALGSAQAAYARDGTDASTPRRDSPLYLIDPHAEVLALFTGWMDAVSISSDLKTIADRFGE